MYCTGVARFYICVCLRIWISLCDFRKDEGGILGKDVSDECCRGWRVSLQTVAPYSDVLGTAVILSHPPLQTIVAKPSKAVTQSVMHCAQHAFFPPLQ